jgi:PmbA protein
MSESLEKANNIINLCQKKCNYDAEVFLKSTTKFEVKIENNVIDTQSMVKEEGFGLRIIDNGKLGFLFSNDLNLLNIEKVIDQAIAVSQKTSKDPANIIPESYPIPTIGQTYSKELVNLTAEEMCSKASQVINGITEDPRITLAFSTLQNTLSSTTIVNTNGIEAYSNDSRMMSLLIAFAREGDNVGSFASAFEISRKNDINLDKMVEELKPKTLYGLNARHLQSDFSGSVILEPDAVYQPFGDTVIMSIEGNNVYRKRSFWKDSMGDEVTTSDITIEDLPLNSEKPYSRAFDEEGVPCRNRTIIDKGVLKTFLQTSKSAKNNEVELTGNACRFLTPYEASYAYSPSIALPTGMTILPGDMSKEELIKDTKNGIIIGRFSGNSRYQNGEYSGVAKQAIFVEDGEIQYPLKGIMIAGNVFNDLKNISGMSKELRSTEGFLETPNIRIEGIKVSRAPN